jgi:hypothetical protein
MPSHEEKKKAHDATVRRVREAHQRAGVDYSTADRKARESAHRATEINERRGWARRKDD